MFGRLDLLKLSVIRAISKKKTIHKVNKRVLSYLSAGKYSTKVCTGKLHPLPFYIPFLTEKVPLKYKHPKTRKLDLQLVLTDTILYSNLSPVYIVKCCPRKKWGTLSAETTCCERSLKRKKKFHPCQSLSKEKTCSGGREGGMEGGPC